MNFYQRMGILPLKKCVNRDKCSFATKQRMFGVFAIDEILRYRGSRIPGSPTLCHPVSDQMELLSRWTVFPNLEIFLFEICFLSCRGCGRTVAPLQPWLGNVTQDTMIDRHNDGQTHAPIHKTIQRLWPVEAFSPMSSSSQTWYLSPKNSSFEAKQLRQKVLNWHICVAWSSLTIICCQHGHYDYDCLSKSIWSFSA